MLNIQYFEYLSTIIFLLAIIHTFFTGQFNKQAGKRRPGSVSENFLHLMGEVEIVFGLWSAVLIIISLIVFNSEFIISYLNGRDFTEAFFVFVVMTICSTHPILLLFEKILINISKLIPIDKRYSAYISILFIGPLFGSLITEPAAMTICAYLLLPRYFSSNNSLRFKYATIALLFINISLGGTLTPYAAPPILMVASKWNWDLAFMLVHFAPKTILCLLINTLLTTFFFRKEILKHNNITPTKIISETPFLITSIHLFFLFLVVLTAHHMVLFVGLFLFFVGFLRATKEYQAPLKLREPLLVSFFLGGLIVLGGPQKWWLAPLITNLSKHQLFFGSIGITALTDNAALTYLGSLVPSLDLQAKLSLVSGSVIGGGLTLIANAPNPAGFGILRKSFNQGSFSPLKLLFSSAPMTIIAIIIFLFL